MKIGAVAITGMFKSAALAAAMVEAGLELPHNRLHEQVRRDWLRLKYKPQHHVSWHLIDRLDQTSRFRSPLETTAAKYGLINQQEIDPIPAFVKPPWQPGPEPLIQNEDDAKRTAEVRANDYNAINFYTDGSMRYGLAGVGIYTPPPFGLQVSATLDRGPHADPTQVELEAIRLAVRAIVEDPVYGLRYGSITYHVMTDSERALRHLQRPGRHKNEILRQIHSLLETARQQQLKIQFSWVPDHSGILGNEMAHILAHSATELGRIPVDKKTTLKKGRKPNRNHEEQKRAHFLSLKVATHLRNLDAVLPGRHVRKLYDRLKQADAAILAQLRGGYCRLNGYLFKIGQTDSERCDTNDFTTNHLHWCHSLSNDFYPLSRIMASNSSAVLSMKVLKS